MKYDRRQFMFGANWHSYNDLNMASALANT